MRILVILFFCVALVLAIEQLSFETANAAWTVDTANTAIMSTYVTGNKLPLTNAIATQFGGASILGLDGGITNASGLSIATQISNATNGTVNAAGTLKVGATINTANGTSLTNNVVSAAANYNVLATDNLVLLSAAHTATLPTAVGIPGKQFTILCSTSGTNAILTTSSQTINGFAKYTNTAQFKFTTVISDNANWWVVGQN